MGLSLTKTIHIFGILGYPQSLGNPPDRTRWGPQRASCMVGWLAWSHEKLGYRFMGAPQHIRPCTTKLQKMPNPDTSYYFNTNVPPQLQWFIDINHFREYTTVLAGYHIYLLFLVVPKKDHVCLMFDFGPTSKSRGSQRLGRSRRIGWKRWFELCMKWEVSCNGGTPKCLVDDGKSWNGWSRGTPTSGNFPNMFNELEKNALSAFSLAFLHGK